MTTKTQEVLQAMFLENTGYSVLDSGGENGRNFQQNQSKVFGEDDVVVDVYDKTDVVVTFDCYMFLVENLTYDNEMQTAYENYAETTDDWGLPVMEEFAKQIEDVEIARLMLFFKSTGGVM